MGKIERIRNFYTPWINGTGSNARRLAWDSTYNQYMRFEVLRKNVDLNGMSLLDVGCGFGDLLDYLNKNEVSVNYTGVDILPRMILIARNMHPKSEFHNIDIFNSDDLMEKYDVAYASGTFNLDMGNNDDFIRRVIDIFYKKTNQTFSFNLLHERFKDKEKYYYYTSPEKIMGLLGDYNCDVKIVDDYLENDFTVICTKKT
ncbi:MAG: class I SAM-dependent methyltransferase [Deltaproteobacteria bacterium]|jgi:cyclopropane fatty-acyl-phospholipid synthase-like methyltransferase|nr:class I SAM-dependent methyltransferase [Deltaproteobacteria bacterium]